MRSIYRRLPAGRRILGPTVGRGLLVSEAELWRRQREVMAPAFTPRTARVLAGHILRCAEATCVRPEAAGDGPIDLLTELQMASRYMATIAHPASSDFLLPGWTLTLVALRRALFRMR